MVVIDSSVCLGASIVQMQWKCELKIISAINMASGLMPRKKYFPYFKGDRNIIIGAEEKEKNASVPNCKYCGVNNPIIIHVRAILENLSLGTEKNIACIIFKRSEIGRCGRFLNISLPFSTFFTTSRSCLSVFTHIETTKAYACIATYTRANP